jgi:two-component system, OmpR family, phosphate regulon response regulator PhoB
MTAASSQRLQPRVLVVDDEEDIVELIAFNLRHAGFEVVTAATGLQALARAEEDLPDIILLDAMLPELDGFAVCEILRRTPATAHTPVIFVTSWGSEEARVMGLEFGGDDYVIKPFSPKELVLRVKNILARPKAA